MADLPIEEKIDRPLTLEERVNILEGDVQEVARGVNVQGSLLEAIVVAFEQVVRKYLVLTGGVRDKDKK